MKILNQEELRQIDGGGIPIYFSIIFGYPFPRRPKQPICDPVYGCDGPPQNS